MNTSTSPALCVITFPGPWDPAMQSSRIYALGSDGLIHEYCQNGVGSEWTVGALSQPGSGSVSAVYYTTADGGRRIEVFTILGNRVHCWTWDFSSSVWSGGATLNYGQDYVFASRTGNTTVVLTHDPERVVTYIVGDRGWQVANGPDLANL